MAEDDYYENLISTIVAAMREYEDSINGPGSFDQIVKKGELLMSKSIDEMTPEELAFLEAPPPSKQS